MHLRTAGRVRRTYTHTSMSIDSQEPVGSKQWTNRARGALIPEAFSSARVGQGSAGNQNPCLLLHTALYSVRTCMDVQDSQSGGERSRGGDRMKKKWLGRY